MRNRAKKAWPASRFLDASWARLELELLGLLPGELAPAEVTVARGRSVDGPLEVELLDCNASEGFIPSQSW